MTKSFLALLFAAALGTVAPAFAGTRLPSTVVPSRYAITLAPDLATASFSGEESIDVAVKAPTRDVVLHAVELAIHEATVQVGGESWPAEVRLDEKTETATLHLQRELPAGAAQLRLRWSGKLNDKLRGLYRAESEGRRFAFTQFEATDARRAYPCFDEPAMKARFQITAVVEPGDHAVSNGSVISSRLDKASGKKIVKFSETLPMSSYLVALAVGPLVDVPGPKRAGKPPIHVWTPPGKEKLAGFALREAAALLDALSSYYGIPYPYGKLDLVAVPDFAAGAMENTGAIFFRETALLVDDKTASTDHRHNVSLTLAHEMAHQWFGDLVTMAWWDDLWLNEAFATWMENKIVDQLHPDWKVWLEFEGYKAHALATDALQATHPIRTPVSSPDEVNEQFDGITYGKGAAVLRMFETWLGEPAFRQGVGDYLRAHAHGNAVAADLWQALTAASSQPVAEVAQSWFEQPGYPVVTIEASCVDDHTQVELAQQRFFATRTKQAAAQTWKIPVCLRTAGGQECTLFSTEAARLALKASGCGWVDANARHAGFYRVKYEPRALGELGRVAEKELDAAERIGLVDDAWSLVQKGATPLAGWLDVVSQLKGEPTPEVAGQVEHGLSYVEDHLLDERDRPLFARFVEELFRPLYARLGWEGRPGESDAQRSLRATVLEALGRLARSPEVLAEAQKRLPAYLANPASFDGTVGGAVVSLSAIAGGSEVYDQLLERMRASHEAEEHQRLLHALGRFEAPALVQRTLALTLTPDVRVQDVARFLASLLHEKATRQAAWQFVKSSYPQLKEKAPPYGFDRMAGATGSFCDEAARKDVSAFFAQPDHRLESQRSLQQAQESIAVCTELKGRESANLTAWLRARGPKHATR
jgi:aminopeptidase N